MPFRGYRFALPSVIDYAFRPVLRTIEAEGMPNKKPSNFEGLRLLKICLKMGLLIIEASLGCLTQTRVSLSLNTRSSLALENFRD